MNDFITDNWKLKNLKNQSFKNIERNKINKYRRIKSRNNNCKNLFNIFFMKEFNKKC